MESSYAPLVQELSPGSNEVLGCAPTAQVSRRASKLLQFCGRFFDSRTTCPDWLAFGTYHGHEGREIALESIPSRKAWRLEPYGSRALSILDGNGALQYFWTMMGVAVPRSPPHFLFLRQRFILFP